MISTFDRSMTTEAQKGYAGKFVTSLLPWLLGAVMFIAFLATLSHGVTRSNLPSLVEVNGWNWRPSMINVLGSMTSFPGPVTYLAGLPFKLLPPAVLPFALNLFSALCAALTLTLLARSVAILPHDRTQDERDREQSEFSILTIPASWAPPVLAVLICGFQITFWENAVAWSTEMLDLLIFAYAVRCLLEYRIHLRESWMFKASLAFGLGMANNWAMIGYFPLFVAAMIWIMGLAFFNPRFIVRALGFGFLGLSLILLQPAIVAFAHLSLGFWEALRFIVLDLDKTALVSFPKQTFLLLALTSILPLFLIGIRWASYFGDTSPLGIFLATNTIRVVNCLFLFACIWIALGTPVSPRHFATARANYLTFYYLAALGIGYFIGYFLLIFGTPEKGGKEEVHPLIKFGFHLANAAIWVVIVLAPTLLLLRNIPEFQSHRENLKAYDAYFKRVRESLPQNDAVVLSDDPLRLQYLRAGFAQEGKNPNILFIDTGSLGQNKAYLRFLEKKNPRFNLSSLVEPVFADTNNTSEVPEPYQLVGFLSGLAASHPIYYLHPSFGYYFERFYLEPRGLVYRVLPYAAGAWNPPPMTKDVVASNQEFWRQCMGAEDVHFLWQRVQPPEQQTNFNILKTIEFRAHLTNEPDPVVPDLCTYYSRCADEWGVELQKLGRYPDAAQCFNWARQFDPDSVAARVNLECNRKLAAGEKIAPQLLKGVEDKFGKLRGWLDVLSQNGPIDEPNYCYQLGITMGQSGNYRQAIQLFQRAKTLSPDNIFAELQLAQIFLLVQEYVTLYSSETIPYNEGYSNALASSEDALRIAPTNANALFLKGVSLIKLGSYDKAIAPLSDLISVQTNNFVAVLNRAIAYLQISNLDAAQKDYLTVLKAAPKSFQIYYGLGEIAYRRNNTPDAVKYYESYLTYAPANTEEARMIKKRLKDLKAAPR